MTVNHHTVAMRSLLVVLALAAGAAGGPWSATPARGDDGLTESPDGPEHVRHYYSLADALDEVFDGADTTWTEAWTPDTAAVAAMEARLGLRLDGRPVTFHRARRGGRDLGWAIELEEKGRFKPITFLVHVQPGGDVGKVLVMVYRESRGDGVRRQRFLRQFRGKRADDALRLNRDVVAVSGATMSSRALTVGVKRALVLTHQRYGADAGARP